MPWTLILLSFFLLRDKAQATCEFRPATMKVYSFSGPVTVIFKEMGLLSKVKGVSLFHPVSPTEYKGEFFPGGVFLSREVLRKLEGGLLFYDESRELSKIVSPLSSLQSVELKTRGLVPSEVVNLVLEKIAPYLQGCAKEMKEVHEKVLRLEKDLLAHWKMSVPVIFFLGNFKSGKAPELVMVNDGVVKWLIQHKKIKTYPTDLAYINWSAKIMNEMPKDSIKVGLLDSGSRMEKSIIKDGTQYTLVYPGALVPGLTQLEAWNYLCQNMKR